MMNTSYCQYFSVKLYHKNKKKGRGKEERRAAFLPGRKTAGRQDGIQSERKTGAHGVPREEQPRSAAASGVGGRPGEEGEVGEKGK